MKRFLVLLVALALAAAGFELKRGETVTLALPEAAEPSILTAQAELERYLPLALGVQVKMGSVETADIILGDTGLTRQQPFYRNDLPEEGFVVAAAGDKLFIFGHDGKFTGTLFGVEDFLQQELGITWIWPGASGEDVPERDSLRLDDFARTSAPSLITRTMTFNTEPGFLEWARRMKLSNRKSGQFGGRKMVFGHSWDAYYFKTQAAQEHPEWLALYAGERRKPHLCTANPEFRQYMANKVVEVARQRQYDVVNISPSDGYGFCECEACRKLDPPGTDYTMSIPNLSNRHWDYAVAVARTVEKLAPGLGVGMFAYTAYRQAPTSMERLPENLFVSFCFSVAYFVKPESRVECYEVLEQYRRLGGKIIGREYWGMHYFMDLPYIYTGALKQSLPELANFGLVGMYGEAPADFVTNAPNYYLVSRLMWQADADSDTVLNRFYQAFGPAAGEIRAYFDTFEQALLKNAGMIPNFGYRYLINLWPDIFPAEVVAQAGTHLDQAAKLAEGSRYAERVRRIGVGHAHTVLRLKMLEVYRRLGRNGEPLYSFSLEGDRAEAAFYKIPLPVDREPFWQNMPSHRLTPAERQATLEEAAALGEQYEQLLREHGDVLQAACRWDEGNEGKGRRPWRQTVKSLLAEEKK